MLNASVHKHTKEVKITDQTDAPMPNQTTQVKSPAQSDLPTFFTSPDSLPNSFGSTSSVNALQSKFDHENKYLFSDKEVGNVQEPSSNQKSPRLKGKVQVLSKITQNSSPNAQCSPQPTEWLSRLPLIDISDQANQAKVDATPSTLFSHSYPRNSSSRRPFPECWTIKIPSYRTAYRHHSIEWLIHLDAVHRITRQG